MSQRSEQASRPLSGRRVLVVDDDPDQSQTTARLLSALGAEVATAADGRAAVEAAAEFAPDVALLDIGLPRMSGREAARLIRRHAAPRKVTLIAMTGWSPGTEPDGDGDTVFDHHLVKPVDPAALQRLVAGAPAREVPAAAPHVRRRPDAGIAGDLSHEIRTPLNTLAGAAHLLRATSLDAEQRSLVDAVERAGVSVRAAVDDLIDLAGAGTAVHDETIFRPAAIAGEWLAPLRLLAEDRRVTLEGRVDGPMPAELIGDGTRIHRLVLRLARAALRSTASGAVEVTAGLAPPDGGRLELRIDVAVKGEVSERDREDDANLAMATIVCERLGGRLWTEATPQGSTVRCAVPVRASAQPTAAPAGSDRRALVCDDDPVSRASAVLLLHEAGFATEVAADGPGALEAARRQRYDAILVDARMPGMDGTAAIRALRSLAPRPAGPVVLAMTASVDARDRSALLDAGADACLVKPLDGDSLRGALAAAARAAQGAAVRRPALAAAVRDTIIGLFLEDTPLLLATLTDAARRGDAAALALAAHRLRGSVATVGASDLLPIATELDACAERGEIAVAARLLQSFGIEWERTRVRLEQTRRVPAQPGSLARGPRVSA